MAVLGVALACPLWVERRRVAFGARSEFYLARLIDKHRAWTGVRSRLISFMEHLISGKGKGDATRPEAIRKRKVFLAFPAGATDCHRRCRSDNMASDDPGVVAFAKMPHGQLPGS